MYVYRDLSFGQGTALRVPDVIDGIIVWWSVDTGIYLLILYFSGTVNYHRKGNVDNFNLFNKFSCLDCGHLIELFVRYSLVFFDLTLAEYQVIKPSGAFFCLISFWGMKPCIFVGFRRDLLPASPPLP